MDEEIATVEAAERVCGATAAPSAEFPHIVVGYDGSPPASRALDAAVRLLQGRTGCIDVVWVAHLSSAVRLSPGAISEMEATFDKLEPELRAQAAGQLRDQGTTCEFERRQWVIADELIAVAVGLRDARPDQGVVIVIGSSSHTAHRMVGLVAVSLARHSPVPLMIVPQARGAPSLGPDPGSVAADRNTTVGSESFKYSERSVVAPRRSGSPVEVLLVGHSLDGGVRVRVVEGSERLVRSDGRLERSA
jgi:nucleotide-binding universal stress UspA family protein